MKLLKLFIAFFVICIVSQGVFADTAIGKVVIYEPSQNEVSGGGGGSRTITIYNLNITNGTVSVVPEQITLPTPKIERNDSERKVLFDIGIRIIKKQVFINENLTSAITLINLGVSGEVNVTIIYRIIDSAGNTVYMEKEIVSVETQTEFLKDFNVLGFSEGEHTLLVEIKYEWQKEPARADDSFIIKKTFVQKFGKIVLVIFGELILVGLVVWFAIKDAIYLKILARKVHIHFGHDSKKVAGKHHRHSKD